jgi:hypothetical protein
VLVKAQHGQQRRSSWRKVPESNYRKYAYQLSTWGVHAVHGHDVFSNNFARSIATCFSASDWIICDRITLEMSSLQGQRRDGAIPPLNRKLDTLLFHS